MTQKKNIEVLLVIALFVATFGGWLLHLRIHPLTASAQNWIPFVAGLLGIIVVVPMFLSKKLLPYAYVVNGMFVIIGSITMGHFSYIHPPKIITIVTLIIGTLFADIAILLTNFFVGSALFELSFFKTIDAPLRTGRIWRYPNMGWWGVHVVTLSIVYVLGHVLWR